MQGPILVTGATGYVGAHLVPALLERGHEVRALTRDPGTAELPEAVAVRAGDALSGDGLDAALEGCAAAYYLIHSMGDEGDGDDDDFAARDRRAARNFAQAARRAGVGRLVYLGGLAGESEHLRSREQTAAELTEHGPPTVHVRAAMVIGPGSDSFEIIRHLVDRLPILFTPRWARNRTQPVAIEDAVATLVTAAEADEFHPEVQLGGADVLTYGEMLQQYGAVAGRRRRPMVRVPFVTPRFSSYFVALVTPVEHGIVAPLLEGLREDTVVRKAPPTGLNDDPMGYGDAVRSALRSA